MSQANRDEYCSFDVGDGLGPCVAFMHAGTEGNLMRRLCSTEGNSRRSNLARSLGEMNLLDLDHKILVWAGQIYYSACDAHGTCRSLLTLFTAYKGRN